MRTKEDRTEQMRELVAELRQEDYAEDVKDDNLEKAAKSVERLTHV